MVEHPPKENVIRVAKSRVLNKERDTEVVDWMSGMIVYEFKLFR